MKTARIKIRMNKEDKEALAATATRMGISVAGFIRMSFSKYNGKKSFRIDDLVEKEKGEVFLLMVDPLEKRLMEKAAKSEDLTISRFLRSLAKMNIKQNEK
jgi:uncharacterized protein (DUF1778 family)